MKYVIDQQTQKRFFYTMFVTIPLEYDQDNNAWLNPTLAPAYMDKLLGVQYLYPTRISEADRVTLAEEYRSECRELN